MSGLHLLFAVCNNPQVVDPIAAGFVSQYVTGSSLKVLATSFPGASDEELVINQCLNGIQGKPWKIFVYVSENSKSRVIMWPWI